MNETELRILSGRHRGAAHPTGDRIGIGHEYWNDVVLREPDTVGLAAELDFAADGAARLTLLSGTLTLLGSALVPGTTVQLPPYVPVRCGGTCFAWGQADSPRWADAEALLPPPVPVAANDDDGAEPAATWWQRPLSGLGRLAKGSVAVAAALTVGAVAMSPSSFDAMLARNDATATATSALREAGYPQLAVRADPEGGVTVSGEIAAEADRPAISYALAEAGVPATLTVRSGAERARAAVDAARINGFVITASARPHGILEIHHGPLDPGARQRLADVLRRDVPGVGRLRFAGDMAPAAPRLASISDATKRVSTVVAGDPGYIVTADGAHYFAGAVLPSGHRLVAIETAAVVLDYAGKQSRLSF